MENMALMPQVGLKERFISTDTLSLNRKKGNLLSKCHLKPIFTARVVL